MNTNRIIALVTALFLAAVMSGCSASLESPKSAQDQSAEIAALRAQVQQLLAAQRQGGEGTGQEDLALEEMTPPPAHRTPRGMPQNWAWTDARPDGCPGELALRIPNKSNYYLNLLIDGIGLSNRGAVGRLPSIAPRSTVWVCLNRTGEHYFSGERVLNRMGVAVVDAKFHFSATFSGGTDTHTMEMTSINTGLELP